MPNLTRKSVLMLLTILSIFWTLAPIIWTVAMSLIPLRSIISIPPMLSLREVNFSSYLRIFGLLSSSGEYYTFAGDELAIQKGLVNSVLVAVPSTLIIVALSNLAGYVFGRYAFRLKGALLGLMLSSRMLPPIALIIPYYFIFLQLGLVGSQIGLIVGYVAIVTPLMTWILMGFYAGLPTEIERASRVDGCTRLMSFRKVILPMARPAIASIGILAFTLCWNEFLFALILTAGSPAATLPVELTTLFSGGQADYSLLAAAVVLGMLPPIVLSSIFQRYITQLRIVDPVNLPSAQ